MMESDTYKTLKNVSEGLYKEKGSKFIALAYPVQTEEEIKEIQEELRKKYHDARHHCYAYRLGFEGEDWRANDDGEPSNSAGQPILGQLRSAGITNVLMVVIRYFGGTKLGVSGLINAYRTAAAEAIEANVIEKRLVKDIYQLHYPYEAMNAVMSLLKQEELEQFDQQFDLKCALKFKVRQSQSARIQEAFTKLEKVNIQHLSTE